MRTYVLSVLSVLLSLSARCSIDFLDLEVSRAQVITGAQSNTISTALQPADVAGWEHGAHLDWALSSSVAGLSNYLASTVSTLSTQSVTNYASPTFSGLSLIRYTNAVSATTFLIDNGEDAPASVYGLYYFQDASHSTNAAGWSLYYEGIGTRYLTAPAGSSGIYTFLGGSLPKFNSSGTGIATGTIRLSQASLPVGYTTTIIDTNGVDGATLKIASVPSAALATAPLYPNGNGSQLTGITVGQVSGAYPSSNPSNYVTSAYVAGAITSATGALQQASVSITNDAAFTGTITLNGLPISNVWQQVYCGASQAGTAAVTPGGRVISNSATNGSILVNAAASASQWTTYQIVCGGNTIYVTNSVYWAAFGVGNDSPVIAAWTQSALTASTYTNKTFIVPPYTTSPLSAGRTYVMLKISGIKTNNVSNFDVFQILARPSTASEISAYSVSQ